MTVGVEEQPRRLTPTNLAARNTCKAPQKKL